VRRAGWSSATREVDRQLDAVRRHNAELRKVTEEIRRADLDAADVWRRLFRGKIDLDEALGEVEALRGKVAVTRSMAEENARLAEELESRHAEYHRQLDASKDFYLVGQLLAVLALFCVTLPAWLLANLTTDPEPFRRSSWAVATFVGALFFVAAVVAEIGWRDERTKADHSGREEQWISLTAVRRVGAGIVVMFALATLTIGYVASPSGLLERGGGKSTPLPATTVAAATPTVHLK
jgi:hypothetical protein